MNLTHIKLKILVFGPNPSAPNPPGFPADLAKKRHEIKTALIADGHVADFPEELMAGSVDPIIGGDIYLWEKMLVQKYDMVVNLVGSFGAVDELGLLNGTGLALKAALFFNQDHIGSLAYSHAQSLETVGAALKTYIYPIDLTSCNLMTQVQERVYAVRVGKFLNS